MQAAAAQEPDTHLGSTVTGPFSSAFHRENAVPLKDCRLPAKRSGSPSILRAGTIQGATQMPCGRGASTPTRTERMRTRSPASPLNRFRFPQSTITQFRGGAGTRGDSLPQGWDREQGAKLGHGSLAQATEQGRQKRDRVPPSPAGHHAGSRASPVASSVAPPCSGAVLSQAEETAALLHALKPALLPVPSSM